MVAILIAKLDEQRFGLRAADVREVLWAVAVTPLPASPEVVEGIIDVRGEKVPVLDVSSRFGHERRAESLTDRFVLVTAEERVVALRFHAVESVIEVDEEAIEAMVTFGPPPRGIAGVVKTPDGLLLIHEMSSFLSSTEAALLEEALVTRAGGASE